MLATLLARFRQFRHQRRQQRQILALSRPDAAALATQPDARRVLVVRNDSIGDYLETTYFIVPAVAAPPQCRGAAPRPAPAPTGP